MRLAASVLFGVALTTSGLVSSACGGGGTSVEEAMKKSDENEKARQAAEKAKRDKEAKAAAAEVKEDPNVLEHPWTFVKVRESLKMGTKLTYMVSGTNAKGKPVTDEYYATVAGNNEGNVKVNEHRKSEANEPIATQTKTLDWANVSPFFALEKAEAKLAGKETVTVPAGEFNCVVAELNGFFGGHRTVWMIADKPGIYAKVVDHGNANEEKDQTEMVFELQTIGSVDAK